MLNRFSAILFRFIFMFLIGKALSYLVFTWFEPFFLAAVGDFLYGIWRDFLFPSETKVVSARRSDRVSISICLRSQIRNLPPQ